MTTAQLNNVFDVELKNAHARVYDTTKNPRSLRVSPEYKSFAPIEKEFFDDETNSTMQRHLVSSLRIIKERLEAQIMVLASRLEIPIRALSFKYRVTWQREIDEQTGRVPPKSGNLEIYLETSSPMEDQIALIQTVLKTCVLEADMAYPCKIVHHLKSEDGTLSLNCMV